MKLSRLLSSAAVACCLSLTSNAEAQELIDFGEYDGDFISFGARVGINTSNMADSNAGKLFSIDSWGTGFDAGVVVDLRVRDWFAIQPGFFFESRSHNFSYSYNPALYPASDAVLNENGHTRHTMFKLPVLFSLRLHPVDVVEWSVDLGPVFNIGLGGHSWWQEPSAVVPVEHKTSYYDSFNRFMMGLKMGTGAQLYEHYYVGVHYEAGLRSARKYGAGGRDKAWTFTIGYNF